jgi:subtilisin-like proprotein convertase family protein
MMTAGKLLRMTAVAMALAGAPSGRAALYEFQPIGGGHYTASWSGPAQGIPDNDLSGVAFALDFAATGLHITDISVSIVISGGWNGDLYAYLSHGSDYAVLLNRVGAVSNGADGYSTSGLNILLQPDSTHPGIVDIHTVQNPATPPTGYAADGRVDYADTSRPQTLDVFPNVDPNGGWTLYFADLSPGSVSMLNGWSLDITAVPEPVNVALSCFGGLFLLITLVRCKGVRKLFRRT